MVRVESSVTSVSWIPSEAVPTGMRIPFDLGVTHYDEPPPDQVDDLDALRRSDRFRFANHLSAWVEVEDGRIVGHGQGGSGHIGSTTVRVARASVVFAAYPLPDLRPAAEVGPTSVRFVQTAGGRAGLPFPRAGHGGRVRLIPPYAWTTVSLTLHADGTAQRRLEAASSFPRHWVYDGDGRLTHKSVAIDFGSWSRTAFEEGTPWGGQGDPALVTEAETALERELSRSVMRRGRPRMRHLAADEVLVRQGEAGRHLFLLLDGALAVDVGGEMLAEVGPGAILGERALLEGGRRTSTLTAVTRCTVAVVPGEDIDPAVLTEISAGHHREDALPS